MVQEKNIVIVGGGTAGWITALIAKRVYQNHNVILIESEKIGILGAGEGSTPYIYNLFNFANVHVYDLVKKCKVTIKTALQYVNWCEKNPLYYNTFESFFNFLTENKQCSVNRFYSECYRLGKLPPANTFITKCCDNNVIPFVKKNEFTEKMSEYEVLGSNALHFDARLLAQHLKDLGFERGIERVEGIVKGIDTDENGYIKSLTMEDGLKIPTTFVFDCTGFKRLIIGQFFKDKWNSLSHMLPAKRALAFFQKPTEEIPPYTGVIAGDYGWIWKIPLQHRYGCGYVFDSNFINDDQAKNEIEKIMGEPVEIVNQFKFEAGYYSNIWTKNCVALGLASGFLEPIEATSIMQLGRCLLDFFSHENWIYEKDQRVIDDFNKEYQKETKEIADFIYLHYVTDKKNSPFWRDFVKNNEMPEFVKHILNISKYRIPKILDFRANTIFQQDSYLAILAGNNLIDPQAIENSLKYTLNGQKELMQYFNDNDVLINKASKHREYLNLKYF